MRMIGVTVLRPMTEFILGGWRIDFGSGTISRRNVADLALKHSELPCWDVYRYYIIKINGSVIHTCKRLLSNKFRDLGLTSNISSQVHRIGYPFLRLIILLAVPS